MCPNSSHHQYVDVAVLDRMAGTKDHMGIIAWVTPFKFRSKMFDPAKAPFILLLDAVQDVRNLGAILRSASCIGVSGVVLCKAMTAPLTGSAFKASAGLAEHLDIYVAPSLRGALQEIKEAGYNLYLAVLEKGEDATTVNYKTPSCLVIGNEASGITKEIRSQGTLVTLPQRVADISFNASVAAGILMFTMAHQTKQALAAAAPVAPVVEVLAE
jgi:23S rRNA (guanosine2251-2'-O)-methyltransferase